MACMAVCNRFDDDDDDAKLVGEGAKADADANKRARRNEFIVFYGLSMLSMNYLSSLQIIYLNSFEKSSALLV